MPNPDRIDTVLTPMRKCVLALLLFQAMGAFAQPKIGAEISLAPLSFTSLQLFLPAPAVAMARDRTGVAMAWPMLDSDRVRIFVVRLDVTGHIIGQSQWIPAASPDTAYFVAPSMAAAPRGNGFTLTWLEVAAGAPKVTRAVFCRLDRDLKPSAPEVLLVMTEPVRAPAIVRSGKTTWLSAGASAWEMRDDGSLSAPVNAGMTATDMTVATDFPQIVAFNHVPGPLTCPPGCERTGFVEPCACPLIRTSTHYSLEFTSLYTITASKNFDFDSDAAPAVSFNGRDVAIVWLQGAHVKGGQVVMSQLLPPSFAEFPAAVSQYRIIGSFGPEGSQTRADIASDGEHYVVVWRTATANGSHDVVGASVDRRGNVIPLTIANSDADERDPSVVFMGDGRFLVAYEKISEGQHRVAARLVTVGSRPRAAH